MDKLTKIQSTGYVQWDVYNIIRNAFCPYRKIDISKSPVLTKDELIKNMQFDNYVKLTGVHEETKNKIVIAILGRNEKGTNEIISITEKFRLFINSIKEQEAEILIIAPAHFQTHVLNFIFESKLDKRIHRYLYDHFKIVIPLAPGSSRHTILSAEESRAEIELHSLNQKEMKPIFMTDPQIIWLGAQPGDIVRIERYNQSSGIGTDVRRVR